MVDGMRDHRVSQNTALVTHFGFLSIFPLMLVATTILGFVLHGHPGLRQDILDSTAERIPIIGPQLKADPTRLTGNVVVLVLGLLAVVWAGTKAFVAMQNGLDDIAEIPLTKRGNALLDRLRALVGMVSIGTAQLATTALTALAGVSGVAIVNRLLVVVGAAIVNTAVLASCYRWLCAQRRTWREVLPGAVAGGLVYVVLQLVTTTYVSRAISKAQPVYGTYAAVIALLSWLGLHALVALLGAELNAALRRRPTEDF